MEFINLCTSIIVLSMLRLNYFMHWFFCERVINVASIIKPWSDGEFNMQQFDFLVYCISLIPSLSNDLIPLSASVSMT